MADLRPAEQRAGAALEVLSRGGDLRAAARAGALELRAVRVVAQAAPGDARAALIALALVGAEAGRQERALRGAVAWPLAMLGLSVLSSGLVTQVALPALRRLPLGGEQLSATPVLLAFLGSVALFVAVVFSAQRRLSLGGVLSAWRSIDAWAFLACTRALVAVDVALPAALRAASTFCAGPQRAAGEALARGLEAGSAEAEVAAPLLGELPSALLVSAAKSGTANASLEALSALALTTLRREVPRDASRIHTAALLVAGAGVALSGIAFYSTYVRAVTG